MQLEKWYCDIVDDTRVQVHYQATLRWGPATLGYRGRLGADGRQESHFQARAQALPQMQDQGLLWELPQGPLRFDRKTDAGPQLTLWQAGEDRLTWQPVVLNGAVSGMQLGPNARGYAEVLRMNFAPWRLGLKKLVWGRFCGQRHSLVWIAWEGTTPRKLALMDGRQLPLQSANTKEVLAEGVRLQLGTSRVIVKERLDQGALKDIPLPAGLARLGPLGLFGFMSGLETKWHAPARLELSVGNAIAVDSGHAIFEEVVWA